MRAFLALLALAAPATVSDGLPLGALPEQSLPPSGCALFLWSVSPERKLVLMTRGDTQVARVAPAGKVTDLARSAAEGAAVLGLTPGATFSDGRTSVSYEIVIQQRPALQKGAAVPAGTLRFDGSDGTTVVTPVAGLIGCR